MIEETFAYLTENDRHLLLARARRTTYRRGDALFREGEVQRNLYIVRKGLVRVERDYHGQGIAVARYGPGQVFGEISFLKESPALGSILAEEDVEVDVLDGDQIRSLLASDTGFASRFFQSLAVCLGARLHQILPTAFLPRTDSSVGRALPQRTGQVSERQLPAALVAAVEDFKTGMHRLAAQLRERQLEPAAAQDQVSHRCDAIANALRQHTEELALVDVAFDDLLTFRDLSQLARGLGGYVFRETFALFMQSATIARCFEKPSGYVEDREVLERIYHNEPEGDGRLGPLIDRWFLNRPVCRARRNGRARMTALLKEAVASGPGPVRVTSLTAGTAQELFDLLADNRPDLYATCLDRDADVLRINAERAREAGCADRITFLRADLLALSANRNPALAGTQRVIYGLGICDYLDDNSLAALLAWVHDHLEAGGEAALTNLDTDNPDRVFMEQILDWPVVQRSREQLQQLAADSPFRGRMEITRDELGVNLFAVGRRE
jgi:extracellular factor (EF) 3-hydroxypalmitic acid methyl ester biosynthesis protein